MARLCLVKADRSLANWAIRAQNEMGLGWILKVLVVVLIARVLWSLLFGLMASVSRTKPVRPQKGMPLVRDPVCGTFVEPTRSISQRAGSQVHYFCSDKCRRMFCQSV